MTTPRVAAPYRSYSKLAPRFARVSRNRNDDCYIVLGPGWHIELLSGKPGRGAGWWLCRLARPMLWLGVNLREYSWKSFQALLRDFQSTLEESNNG